MPMYDPTLLVAMFIVFLRDSVFLTLFSAPLRGPVDTLPVTCGAREVSVVRVMAAEKSLGLALSSGAANPKQEGLQMYT